MAVRPPIEDMEWQGGGSAQLLGPLGASLRDSAFLGVELSPNEAPMVLAGAARLLAAERTIYCADACNCFDVYRLSHWARSMGMNPTELLDRVFLSRAFTIHQLSALATEQLAMLPGSDPRPLIMVLGIEALFLDEQLPLFEREHHYRKVLGALVDLRGRGFSLLVTMGQGQVRGEPDKRRWRHLLSRAADAMTRVRQLAGGAFVLEQVGGSRGYRQAPVFRESKSAALATVVGEQTEIVL